LPLKASFRGNNFLRTAELENRKNVGTLPNSATEKASLKRNLDEEVRSGSLSETLIRVRPGVEGMLLYFL
jgi:hypothetical protein